MERYELTEKDIERGLFLARYKVQIRIGITLAIALFIGILILISASNYFNLLTGTGQLNSLMAQAWQDTQNWESLHRQNAPQDIVLGEPLVLGQGNNIYDLYVLVENPNEKWALESFDFQFSLNGKTVASGSDFLLPEETKYVGVARVESSDLLDNVNSVTRFNVQWKRVKDPLPPVWNFTAEPRYRARQVISDNGGTLQVPASVTWSVTNMHAETVRQPKWQIILYNGNKPVSVINYTGQTDVNFLDSLDYDVSIFGNLSRIDRVEVLPILNFFDDSTFYLPQFEPRIER